MTQTINGESVNISGNIKWQSSSQKPNIETHDSLHHNSFGLLSTARSCLAEAEAAADPSQNIVLCRARSIFAELSKAKEIMPLIHSQL